MGDFRDGLVAGLLQAPPSDERESASVKQVLVADLERQCQRYAQDVEGSNLVARLKHALAALPCRPLTQDDMRDYVCLEIKKRIRKMLDADVASGRLVVSVTDGKQVVLLDDFAVWAILHKNITPEQPALPGCEHSFLHDAGKRLRQRLLDEETVVVASPQRSDRAPVTPADARRNRAALDITLERGARRRILEQWDDVEKKHGQGADAHQVLRVMKRDKDEKQPALKTVQNLLIVLRTEGLIP